MIPPQDYGELYKDGAAAIFGPGTVITQAALRVLDLLEQVLASADVRNMTTQSAGFSRGSRRAAPDQFVQGILGGDRRVLSRFITLLESGVSPRTGVLRSMF